MRRFLASIGLIAASAPALAGTEIFAVTYSFLPPPFGAPRKLLRIDIDTGATTVVGELAEGMSDLTFDHATKTLYGAALDSSFLYRINRNTAGFTRVGSFNANFFLPGGLEWDSSTGTLYAMNAGIAPVSPAQLHRIDHNTGQATLIGRTFGNRISFPLGYDSVNDVMYVGSQEGLHTIDRATGIATRIGGGPLTSLAFHPSHGMITAIGNTISRVDLATGLTTPMVTFDGAVEGISFVPAPGALGVLALGGLAAARRRRGL